jgi:hypothetical protein
MRQMRQSISQAQWPTEDISKDQLGERVGVRGLLRPVGRKIGWDAMLPQFGLVRQESKPSVGHFKLGGLVQALTAARDPTRNPGH